MVDSSSSKSSSALLLLILMLFISTTPPILGCDSCSHPKLPPHKTKHHPKKPITHPPITGKPPVTILPPVIGKPPVTVPPITLPPVTGSPPPAANCPPPPPPPAPKASCPVDSLKLGACVDLLGGLIHIGLGDPVVNKCCPLLSGLVEIEAAVCLCTTIRLKLLDINIYLPLALQLLLTCGKTPPPGYTCTV